MHCSHPLHPTLILHPVFVAEFVLMVCGNGFYFYFADKENIVNFIVTLVSVVDVYLTVSITTDTDTTDTVYFDLCPLTVDR